MKNRFKKLLALSMSLILVLGLSACGSSKTEVEKEKIVIAYQYGLAYAPLLIMKEQGLIEKYYENVEVEWVLLNSGAAINEGIVSGDIDVGAIGVGPFVTGVTAGIPYKIYSAISSQPNEMTTSDPDINSLSDITSEDKIALVNIGSIQHILLAMAAEKELGDAHSLDNNIVAMAHPDGMTALISGSVPCHLTSSPYLYKELDTVGIRELSVVSEVWPQGSTFIVGVASTKLYDENRELYDAVASATSEAMDYINNNKEAVAELLCVNEDVSAEVMLGWLNNTGSVYSVETKGVTDMADFMERADFLTTAAPKFEDMVFDNVNGN